MNWQSSWTPKTDLDHMPSNQPKQDEYLKGITDRLVQVPPPIFRQEPTNPYDALDQDALLMLHKQMQDDIASLKEKEMELRKYIVNRAFPKKEEGTNTLELGNGYELKAVVKYNYRLADNEIVEKTLEEIAKCGNSGAFIADRLVSWTPNFQKGEYNKLNDEAAAGDENAKKILKLVSIMLEITDAAPTLAIKEPKAKKNA